MNREEQYELIKKRALELHEICGGMKRVAAKMISDDYPGAGLSKLENIWAEAGKEMVTADEFLDRRIRDYYNEGYKSPEEINQRISQDIKPMRPYYSIGLPTIIKHMRELKLKLPPPKKRGGSRDMSVRKPGFRIYVGRKNRTRYEGEHYQFSTIPESIS